MCSSVKVPGAIAVLTGLILAGTGCSSLPLLKKSEKAGSLRDALTFHASFDRGADADFALGDTWIYHAPEMEKWSAAKPGLPEEGVRVVPDAGKFGGALHFEERGDPVLFYRGGDNIRWTAENWSGTVSLWMRTDLAALSEGFCDPVQVTPRGWNDAALFIEFEKRGEVVPFRLGAYADFKVWNPKDIKWADIPPAARPLVTITGPPFSGDRWTHVVFTWDRFNTGQADGTAVLYLDGAQVGTILNRKQTFTWNPALSRLLLGVGYVGWIDEVAVFNRALTASEVQALRRLPAGIRSLQQ